MSFGDFCSGVEGKDKREEDGRDAFYEPIIALAHCVLYTHISFLKSFSMQWLGVYRISIALEAAEAHTSSMTLSFLEKPRVHEHLVSSF
jgi:hypothetical protein